MIKQSPSLEWQIVQDDTEWMLLSGQPLSSKEGRATAASQGRCWAKWFLYTAATLLFLLVSDSQAWPSAPPELLWSKKESETVGQRDTLTTPTQWDEAPIAGQIASLRVVAAYQAIQEHQSFAVRQTATDWQLQFAQEQSGLRTAMSTGDPDGPLAIVLPTFEFWGDQAIVHLVTRTMPGAPAYRQTRFYRRTAAGWQQTAPDPALWGPERSLETPSFTFRFRQRDAAAVIAVAPRVEELYTTMRRNYGLPISLHAEKLEIQVSVTQPPGHILPWLGVYQGLRAPSPALYRAPVELTDADLLAQSLARPLLAHLSAQASERHQIGAAWQPLLSGLELWQLWDLDLPLAIWREEVVKWVYLDLPATPLGEAIVLPLRYDELCAAHTLWVPSPVQIHIPLWCNNLEHGLWNFYWWGAPNPLIHLDQLAAPITPDPVVLDAYQQGLSRVQRSHPGQAVAVATLIEYAVATYGRERLPALVAGLGQYESWETLLPAVYGVSLTEFEAGWQAYLAEHYGVSQYLSVQFGQR